MKRFCVVRSDMLVHLPWAINTFNAWLNEAQFQYTNIDIYQTPEIKLFYFILDNYVNDIQYIFNKDIDTAFFGFIPVIRNLRISVEALLDMYCLINVPDYVQVLEYQGHKRDFKNINVNLQNRANNKKKTYTNNKKMQIALDYGYSPNGVAAMYIKDTDSLKEANAYTHASIFIPQCTDHLYQARTLLQYELDVLNEAFSYLQKRFTRDYCIRPYYEIPIPVLDTVGQKVEQLTFPQIIGTCKDYASKGVIFEAQENFIYNRPIF